METAPPTVNLRIQVRIKSTGYGSDRYGNCECCGKHCSEVFLSTVQRQYIDPDTSRIGLTHHGVPQGKWGHLTCVESFANQITESGRKGDIRLVDGN